LIVVDWVITVHVLARGPSIIDGVGSIVRPEGVNKVILILEVSASSSLTETVQGGAIALIRDKDTRVYDKLGLN
jgi:hypothetical protein